jgi:translation initiation factor 2 beta subunit (eIF-2beta)/eIF-5
MSIVAVPRAKEKTPDLLFYPYKRETAKSFRVFQSCSEKKTRTNWTCFTNAHIIAKQLMRTVDHLRFYLRQDLHTLVTLVPMKKKSILQIKGSFKSTEVDDSIENFVLDWILCHECESVNTRIVGIGSQKSLFCRTCAAFYPLFL